MSEMRELLWKVIGLGPRSVLRRHGFRRPGGGTRFFRQRDPLKQVVSCRGSWSELSHTAQLELWIEQRLDHHVLWSLDSPQIAVDLIDGDPGDSSVAVAHWLETVAIPALDATPDLVALAREYEVKNLDAAGQLWGLLGYPNEARRAEEAANRACPF